MNAKILSAACALMLGLAATAATAETVLVMVEQDGCDRKVERW